MDNVKQLLTSYLELMEKGESAAGWKKVFATSTALPSWPTRSSGCRDQPDKWLLS